MTRSQIWGIKMSFANEVADRYRTTRSESEQLHGRAKSLFPANGATHGARILEPFRPYIVRAQGFRKWDVDGNEYVDYCMGHGALILGHGNQAVVDAIKRQAERGLHYSENHQAEIEWAELITRMMPATERIEFCASGQEANLLACRVARTFTGRRRILRFEENFHGWAGEVAPANSAGVSMPDVTVLPMNDTDLLERELATRQYALVMTEGSGAHMGQIPWDPSFIRDLGEMASAYGTLWMVDEVVTGFRESRGGWQEVVGANPDLTSLGKCVAGGLPAGALAGRADVMEVFDPKRPPEKRIRHTGTWNANPLQCAAGVAACKQYLDGGPQARATELGAYFRDTGNVRLRKRGIGARLYGRTIVHLYLGPLESDSSDPVYPPTTSPDRIMESAQTITNNQLCLRLLERGIATMGGRMFILSSIHTMAALEHTVEALELCLDELMEQRTVLPA